MTENLRKTRAFGIIGQAQAIRQVEAHTFKVRSQSGNGQYVVTNGAGASATALPDAATTQQNRFSLRELLKRSLIPLLACLLLLALPLVSPQQLPVSGSLGPLTLTLSSYTLTSDRRGAIAYGLVRSDFWLEAHVLSAYATLSSTQYLGRADLQGTLILKPHTVASTSVALSSPYTIEQLGDMSIQSVRVYAELRYCAVLGWWCGPAPIPWWELPPYTSIRCDFASCTVTYDHIFTPWEIGQLAQEYA